MGLFAFGTDAQTYIHNDLIGYMLNELDELFDGKASTSYVKHIFQNWNAEPYANGAYIHDHENWRRVRTLGESVADKLLLDVPTHMAKTGVVCTQQQGLQLEL